MNINIILNDATNPNSCSVSLSVSIKAAKPEAVVKLVSRVILPILLIIKCNELYLSLFFLNSV